MEEAGIIILRLTEAHEDLDRGRRSIAEGRKREWWVLHAFIIFGAQYIDM